MLVCDLELEKRRGRGGERTAHVNAIEGLVGNSPVDAAEGVLYRLGNGLLKSDGAGESGAGRRSGSSAGDLGSDPASSDCEGGHFDELCCGCEIGYLRNCCCCLD